MPAQASHRTQSGCGENCFWVTIPRTDFYRGGEESGPNQSVQKGLVFWRLDHCSKTMRAEGEATARSRSHSSSACMPFIGEKSSLRIGAPLAADGWYVQVGHAFLLMIDRPGQSLSTRFLNHSP